MKPAVYIQSNERQSLAARVAAHAMMKSSARPGAFDVVILNLDDFPTLTAHDGDTYLSRGDRLVWRRDHLQSFTLLRFVVPQLRGYRGRALVVDPDVFAVSEVGDLLTADLEGRPLAARRVPPKPNRPEAYFDTSVMVLDCERLEHWRWGDDLEEMFALRRDYRTWMTLGYEHPEAVVHLDEVWNSHDRWGADTRLLHMTRMDTQPWKTGLPVDFFEDWDVRTARGAARTLRAKLRRGRRRYIPHPDERQEALFFQLLDDALREGVVTEGDVASAAERNFIRHDWKPRLAAHRAS